MRKTSGTRLPVFLNALVKFFFVASVYTQASTKKTGSLATRLCKHDTDGYLKFIIESKQRKVNNIIETHLVSCEIVACQSHLSVVVFVSHIPVSHQQ